MGFLRNIASGAVSANIDQDSDQYRELVATKNYEDVNSVQADQAVSRFMAVFLPPAAVGADVTTELSDGIEDAISVTSVTYTPNADITGADTNSRTISVVAGPDKSSPISVASLALTSGVNAAGGSPKTITAAPSAVPAGEPLIAKSTHVGTGIADPGGLLVVNYTEA